MSGRDIQRRREGMHRDYALSLVEVMATPAGRTAIWGILEKTALFADLMTGNSYTFHNVGKRDVGLSLWADLQLHCRTEARLMEDEASARSSRVAFERDAEQQSDPENQSFLDEA